MVQLQKQYVQSMPVLLAQKLELRMEVVFGTPSQNCIGSGVCMVMHQLPPNQILRCPNAPAWISYDKNLLVFRFPQSEMLRADAVSRFSSSWFFVQESFQLPRYTARRLGMPIHWVSPGLYPIEETVKDWLIAFRLLEKGLSDSKSEI